MRSFLKIAPITLLPAAIGVAGCLAPPAGDEIDDEALAEALQADSSATTPVNQVTCGGPGNLIGSLPYALPPLPAYYGNTFLSPYYGGSSYFRSPSYYGGGGGYYGGGTPYLGGVPYFNGPSPYYGSGAWPGYSGYWGGYGGGYSNPAYYGNFYGVPAGIPGSPNTPADGCPSSP